MSFEVTEEMISRLSPEGQVIVRMLLAENAKLQKRVAALEAKLNKTSKNSSKPPSAGHPHARPEPPPRKKSKRKRGGQPGHERYQRELVPTKQCSEVVTRKPNSCRRCGSRLRGSDKQPLRKQIHDVVIQPVVTEYQLHRLACDCGTTTCGQLPDHVNGETGPTLAAILVLLTSWFRTSRKKAAVFSSEICGVPCSKGHVSELEAKATAALAEPVREIAAAIAEQPNLKIDETPFKRGRTKTWLWTFVASGFTLFVMRPTRGASVLVETIGDSFRGSINCDRAKMYFQFDTLQWCWSHLRRDFQAMVDSKDGAVRRLGHDLMRETKTLFSEVARCRDGTIRHSTMVRNLRPVRRKVERLLLRGFGTQANGTCRELFRHRENLWTFLRDENVEPTNNAAERSLRHGVIWRKLTHGTRSERGDRFVETMLTVIETCRQQNRSVIQCVKTALNPAIQNISLTNP